MPKFVQNATTPRMNAKEVIRIGRNRRRRPSSAAWTTSRPSSRRSFANSTIKIAFFAYVTVLTWQMMDKMANYKMTIIDLPMSYVYGVCMVGFAFSTVRAVQVAIENWRRGYTHLEQPEAFMESSL